MENLLIGQKMDYIQKNCKKLTKSDAIDVGKLIMRNGAGDYLRSIGSGLCVDLDALEKNKPGVVNQIYLQIHHKISNK